MGFHWRASSALNGFLLGDKTRPLCSSVFDMPPSRWRTAYLLAMDLLFSERDHCLNIHLRWITMTYLGGEDDG